MKKMFKLFFVTILSFAFITSVYAVLSKDEIDFENKYVQYNSDTGTFNVVATETVTIKYQDTILSNDTAINEVTTAYNNYKDSSTDANQVELVNMLARNAESFSDADWEDSQDSVGDLTPGTFYVRWAQITDSAGTVKYAFGLYKVAGESNTSNSSTSNTSSGETNPETGFSPLYIIPVMAVLGTGLVFRRRRYE